MVSKIIQSAALALALTLSSAAFGQPEDPRITIWKQLYLEQTERLVAVGAQATTLSQENARLREELAKKKDEPPK